MDYYIGSSSIMDYIISNDGVSIKGIIGGAGTYALAGGSLWTDSMYLVNSMSTNQMMRMRKWFIKNNFSTNFINTVENNSPVNRIEYFKDGTKKEKRSFNEEYFKQFEYTSDKFVQQAQEDCAIYIFRNVSEDFWNPFLEMTNKKATILWRIAHDACQPKYLKRVKIIADKLDVFSINLDDSKELFGVDSLEEVYAELKKFKTPLVLLTNADSGMVFLKNRGVTFIPYFNQEDVVDLTGGDDGASAAVLVGYCQGKNIFELGFMANHSRLLCIQQYGLPDSIREYRERKFLYT